MSVELEATCQLCATALSALAEPAVSCFGTKPIAPQNVIKYTVAEVLNKHFWFQVSLVVVVIIVIGECRYTH